METTCDPRRVMVCGVGQHDEALPGAGHGVRALQCARPDPLQHTRGCDPVRVTLFSGGHIL